tara:strand:+ start:37 stop:612 length:576 start_codon:yes stop_codon:yes gene_type:complete
MVNVEVIRISYYPPSKGYAVLLQEIGGEKQLPIIVGSAEAQAIALALEGIEMPRPMTHDLIKDIIDSFDSKIEKVIVSNLSRGTYFAQIVIKTSAIGEMRIDSRPSDAIAIALKTMAPVYVKKSVIQSASLKNVVLESGTTTPASHETEFTKHRTLDNLKEALEKAIEDEQYEIAAKIRDKISHLEEGNTN